MKRNILTVVLAIVFLNCSKKNGMASPDDQGPHVYYVSASGADNTAGSAASPFRTLNHALGLVVPGDTVILRGGSYYEQVSFPKSGLAGKNITVKAYPGEKPVIDGSHTTVAGWQAL